MEMTFAQNWDREITDENVLDFLTCPRCNTPLEIHPAAVWCPDCAFEIIRDVITAAGSAHLSIWALAALLRNEQNVMLGAGMYARMKPGVQIEITSDLRCPLCGGTIVDRGITLISCEFNERDGNGCKFRVWKTALSGRGYLKLDNEQVRALIAGRMISLELACRRGYFTKYYVRLRKTWEGWRIMILDNDYSTYPKLAWPDPVAL